MIVQRGDLESVVERDAHHRIHLVFAEHHVAHDHRLLAGLLEGSPGSEPHRWCNANGPRENLEIAARSGDLVDLLLLVELPFQTGELVDLRRVERGSWLGALLGRGKDHSAEQAQQYRACKDLTHRRLLFPRQMALHSADVGLTCASS